MYTRTFDPFTDPFINTPKSDVNPYVQKLNILGKDPEFPFSYGEDLRLRKGAWKNFFQSIHENKKEPRKLIVEVGCYTGSTLTTMAELNQDVAFIGLDITFKRVYISAQKFVDKNLKNAYSLLFNGKYIEQIFESSELDGLLVFFPDPWMKKRQQKNRLLNEEFVQKIKRLVKQGGFFWFKSDQPDYFEQSKSLMEDQGFRLVETLDDPFFSHVYTSPFEKTFKAQNLPTFSAIWEKL